MKVQADPGVDLFIFISFNDKSTFFEKDKNDDFKNGHKKAKSKVGSTKNVFQ